MKNLRIKYLLMAVTSGLIGLTLIVGGLGYHATQRSVELLEQVALRSAQQQLTLANIVYQMESNRSQILQALQHNPDSKHAAMHDHPLANHFNNIANHTAALRREQAALQASIATQATRDAVAGWQQASQGFGIDMIEAAATALRAENWDGAQNILIKQINPTYLAGQTAYRTLQSYMEQRNAERSASLHEELRFLNLLSLGVIIAAVALASAATAFLVRAITQPLEAAVSVARRVAEGDLSVQVTVDRTNEFGHLLSALNHMSGNLARIVGQVRSGSELIASASSQISSGNMDLSARTEQQASSIEETAASVEELTTTVRQNADNARQANGLAESASEIALRGGAVVAEVVDTMGAINESARKIVDIIAVIDGIAFQTNILPLNAAVEAARAGEQGRGFAVVATEVRSLAQRSANAAREIKTLITDSVTKVDSGTRLVDQAGATMQELVRSVRNVADIMAEITVASKEQSAGIEQIHQAIGQMDQVTQQNAALVEEAASASQSLRDSAADLAQQVSVFTLAGAHGKAGASPRPKAAPHPAPSTARRRPASAQLGSAALAA